MGLPALIESVIVDSVYHAIASKTGSASYNTDIDRQVSDAIRDIEAAYESGYVSTRSWLRWRTNRWIKKVLAVEHGPFYAEIVRSLEALP